MRTIQSLVTTKQIINLLLEYQANSTCIVYQSNALSAFCTHFLLRHIELYDGHEFLGKMQLLQCIVHRATRDTYITTDKSPKGQKPQGQSRNGQSIK